jgi:methyl-accepting chemotaxis protein
VLSDIENRNINLLYRKELAAKLDYLLNQLQQFLDISENDFLVIGGKLRDYQGLCNKINNLAKNIIQTIGTEILSSGITELGFLMNTIGEHLTNSAQSIEKEKNELLKIQNKLSCIEDNLDGFDKIVKTLRMLGISSKIESARLNLMDGGFFLLAETVEKMSIEIGERKLSIKVKSRHLVQQVTKSFGDILGLETEQQKQNKKFKNSAASSLESFKQKNLVCVNAIGEMNIVGTNLTEYLRNIVEAVQFHDITRQQLQHVCEVIVELVQKVNDDNNYNDNELFSHVYDNSQLQASQLYNTLQDFTKSVMSIIDSLKEVESGTHQLFDLSRKIIGFESSQNKMNHNLFEQELIFITDSLQKSLLIDQNLDTSISDILSVVTDLVKQIETIEEVGDEIELIALNARVKAIHLGTDGEALSVLAEAIQKLSMDAKEQTVEIFELLKTVDNLSGNMRSEFTDARHQTSGILLQTTLEDMNRLVASIKEVENNAMVEINKLDEIVNFFKDELQSTINNISIHVSAEQILSPLTTELHSISDELQSRFKIDSQRIKNTSDIMGKYTMQSEREVHTKFTKASDDAAGRIGIVNDSDGLGDNIELF